MKKEELLKRLEELNTISILKKNDCEEYRKILDELEQMRVPPLSLTLEKESDRQTLLSSLDNNVIPLKVHKILKNNNIETVGELLDLNRLDTSDLVGFGPKKWIELYAIQQFVYKIFTNNADECDIQEPIPLFSFDELKDISKQMLALEGKDVKRQAWDKNKYNELLIGLNRRGQKRSDIYQDEDIYDVSVDVLDVNTRLMNLLESLGLERMVQIIDVTKREVQAVPQKGKKSWTEIVGLKMDIIDHQDIYLEKYKKYFMIHELPETSEDLPLYQKYVLAVTQLAEILESRGRKRDSYIIKEFFIKGTSVDAITKELAKRGDSLDKERIRQITDEMQERIMSGSENPLIGNAYFSDTFIDDLNTVSQDVLYCPLSYANQVLQAPADFDSTPIIRLLGLSVLDVNTARKPFMDAPRIISADDSVSFIASHLKAVNDTMNIMALPASKDEIISRVMNLSFMSGTCDINVFERILVRHSWIEKNDDQQYSFIYSKLKRAETKAARIVYEYKKVTTADIQSIDAQRMHVVLDEGLSITAARIIAQYPWVSRGAKNNELLYKPIQTASIPSLRVATELYAKQHVVFKFDDMVRELNDKGYSGYAIGSFRSYVLKCCVPSNKDSNLLCLESEIQNHEPDTWRNRTVQGTTNWVINSCIKILGDKKLKKSELNRLVISQPEADNYNLHNIFSVYIGNYCCSHDDIKPNKLFITQDEKIWVNQQCINDGLVDLETVGSVNRQPDYYMDVMTEIVNLLKLAKDQRMKLAHLKQHCLPMIALSSKETIFYKLINKLPVEVERVEIGGATYLQLKTEELSYEKSYSLPEKAEEVISDEISQISAPQVVETTKPEKVYIRGKIDWGDMASELKRELDYYNRWWDIKGITLEEGVDKFVSLLENSSDDALHGDVSRHIFEFLTQKLDRYDLHDHMKSIVLGAEPIIRGIYMLNNSCSSCPNTHGLSDCIALVPRLQYWVDDIFSYKKVQKYYDFRKTYLDFYNVRNKFAHGVSVELNTVGKYQATYGYLALYIYIYCRFLEA